jgi:hypothetical protein
LTTEVQCISNLARRRAIEYSDTATVTSPESPGTDIKCRAIDQDIFVDPVCHTVETATLQMSAKNYGRAEESLLTVLNSEDMYSVGPHERYKVWEMLGIIYCHQRRQENVEQILQLLVCGELSKCHIGSEALRMMVSLAEIRLLENENA